MTVPMHGLRIDVFGLASDTVTQTPLGFFYVQFSPDILIKTP